MEFTIKLHEDKTMNHDLYDKAFEELLSRVPSISACINCGSCTGTCVAAPSTGLGFRKLLVCLRHGSRGELVRLLKYCQLCGKCWLICPRGIDTRKATIEMKSLFTAMNECPS